MIFNLGSFFNSAKKQAQAEREREHQIYARWAEASRRAEERGGPLTDKAAARPSNFSAANEFDEAGTNGGWRIGGEDAEAKALEEEITFSLTEADIIEAGENADDNAAGPNWLTASDVDEESGSGAGDYLGDPSPGIEPPDDRQFEFTFEKTDKSGSEKIKTVDIAFTDLMAEKIEHSKVSAGLPASPAAAVEPAPTAAPEQTAKREWTGLGSSAPIADMPAAPAAKPAAASLLDRKTPGFLRGLSAAVERTIASASAVKIGAVREAEQQKTRPAASSNGGWSRLSGSSAAPAANSPAPIQTAAVQASAVQAVALQSPTVQASMGLAQPARLSADGMIDDRLRPLQALKVERPFSPAVATPPAPKIADGRIPPADMQIDVERDLRARFGANMRSALGCGTVIEGKFTFDSPVRIDGSLTGDIVSNSLLIVGEHAIVRARVDVGSLIVLGEVTGDITASELVEIRSTGTVRGDLTTTRIAIQEGGFYQGNITLNKSKKA